MRISLPKKAMLVAGAFLLSVATAQTLPSREGEVIVVYKSSVSPQKRLSDRSDLKVLREFPALSRRLGKRYALIRSNTKSTQALIDEMESDPDVLRVEPNYIRHLSSITPDDPDFEDQWALKNTGQTVNGTRGSYDADIDADEAWEESNGSKEVVVAVIDTGINYTHEDLRDNMWVNTAELNGEEGVDDDGNGYVDDIYGYDFAATTDGDNDSDPMDEDGHGTMAAGVIGAVGDNGTGVTGVAWNVSLMALKVADPNGDISNSDLFEAFDYLLMMKEEKGVNIVIANASYSGPDYSQTEKDYIDSMADAGILLAAAAGNDGKNIDNYPEYPASYSCDNIIAVAASDQEDQLPVDSDTGRIWSNYGSVSVDLAAPGVNLLTPDLRGDYSYFSGTSAATPMVSGAVAVLADAFPDEGYQELRARILNSVDQKDALEGYVATGGRLNLAKALDASTVPPPEETIESSTTAESGGGGGPIAPWAIFGLLGIFLGVGARRVTRKDRE